MVCILSTFCPAPLTEFLLNSGQFNVAVAVHVEVISNIHLGPGCGGWPGAAAGARAVTITSHLSFDQSIIIFGYYSTGSLFGFC